MKRIFKLINLEDATTLPGPQHGGVNTGRGGRSHEVNESVSHARRNGEIFFGGPGSRLVLENCWTNSDGNKTNETAMLREGNPYSTSMR